MLKLAFLMQQSINNDSIMGLLRLFFWVDLKKLLLFLALLELLSP